MCAREVTRNNRSVPCGCTLSVGSLFIHWLSLCSVSGLPLFLNPSGISEDN